MPGLLALALLMAPPGDPRLAPIRVAPGYSLSLAAAEPMVVNPVTMTWGPDARLYVAEWTQGGGPNDHIKVLTDVDGDGTFDKVDRYMSDLEMPAGIAFWDGWTYLSLGHEVVRLHDPDLDGKADKREVVLSGFGNDDSHHRVSGLTFGPDGWLYVTTGDSDAHAKGSDGSTSTVLRCGGVFRCRPDGSNLENFAFGMRNPWGNVAFDDEFRIFHTDNDNEGAPGFTGCRILHVVEAGDYGWRLREGARCCQPDYDRATWNGGRPGRLGWVAETGRGAPAGLCVLNSAAFPPSTRNMLIYPDVFRKNVRAYKLKPSGATFTVDKEFELLASDDGLFRPTDAEIGPDGALYVLDWSTDSGGAGKLSGNGTTGRIYRVTWGGTAEEPSRTPLSRDRLLTLDDMTDDSLIASLGPDDYHLRLQATQTLIRRMVSGTEDASTLGHLLGLADGRGGPERARRHAIVALFGAGSVTDNRVLLGDSWTLIDDPDPAIRRLAYGLLARAKDAGVDTSSNRLPMRRARQALIQLESDGIALRAKAMALGGYPRLRRARPGEEFERSTTDLVGWLTLSPKDRLVVDALLADIASNDRKILDIERKLAPGKLLEANSGLKEAVDQSFSKSDTLVRVVGIYDERVSADLIGAHLLSLASSASSSDAFLIDGFTRGLERLGPAGLDAILRGISSGDPKRSAAALFALQGWRGKDGTEAVLSAATGDAPIPAEARAGLFKALRELGDAVPPAPIAAWLSKSPTADEAPRVAAIHVLEAAGKRAMLDIQPIVPGLLADGRGEVRKAALGLARNAPSAQSKPLLLAIAADASRPADERRLSIAALRVYEDKSIAPTLAALVDTSDDAAFRGELLRALAPLDFDLAAQTATVALASKDQNLRREAIALMGQRPATALIVARMYNSGKLPSEDLARVVEAVRSHATPELQEATQALLKDKLLAAPTGPAAARLREFVAKSGSPDRGRAIYLDAKKGGCVTCHRLEGSGGEVGPDLTKIWETLSFDKRVESILDPSKEIKEGYDTYKVATTDGRVLTGLLVSKNDREITLKDAQAREVKVPIAEVERQQKDAVSLMPAGVVGHLSLAELADLLAFLGDRKAQEALRTK